MTRKIVGETVVADHGLGHGHATAIVRLVTKGPEFVVEHHAGGVLHLDGLAARR
ncbi:DUF4287 domain-containing protein [Amycolatopsis rifamycinica]|uniref:DUF4287 domain-containing protein n=1 Tax=Amycolatopsis rifamycinica TaxID=287986 RepID=UPI001F2656F0|nr:DUF4287 domain-containing protein [Amycolatopsis rifamycinica]